MRAGLGRMEETAQLIRIPGPKFGGNDGPDALAHERSRLDFELWIPAARHRVVPAESRCGPCERSCCLGAFRWAIEELSRAN